MKSIPGIGNKAEMKNVHESLEKNTASTSGLREDFQRLRGEINGTLPRIEVYASYCTSFAPSGTISASRRRSESF
jgi:hypothetical protein